MIFTVNEILLGYNIGENRSWEIAVHEGEINAI
jgi:hypothetical protein